MTCKVLPKIIFILLLIIINFSLYITNCSAQSITWQRAYDDPQHSTDGSYTICPADGSNIYISGFAGFIPPLGYVIKINAFGDTLWQKKINQVGYILSSIPVADGSCVFTGSGGTCFSCKILPTGQISWLKYYGGHTSSQIIRTADSGFIGCGDGGNLNSYIYKLDSNGTLIWGKYYGSSDMPYFRAITLALTNGYIVCGDVSDSPNDSGKGYIANINDTGGIVWEKRYYGKSRGFEKISRLNNGYLIAGVKFDTAGTGFLRAFIMRTDINGDLTNFKEFNSPSNESASDLMVVNNNRYVLVLRRDSAITYNSRILILDSSLNVTKQKSIYDSRGTTSLSGIITAPNSPTNDYVLAGYTTITSASDDIYAIRIDSSLTNLPPFGIQNISTEIPNKFLLYQNFPNPFNPATKIKFDLPKDELASVKVYDILGKVVFTISEFKKAGTYEVNFDGTNLASGLYFYKLEAGSFVETKKMVILK